MRSISILLLIFLLLSCSHKTLPYKNGPSMSEKNIRETFRPILEFMDYKPGMTFADVGAGSGALSVMMASLMDNSAVYIQDIDTAILNEKNIDIIIDYYSKQSKKDLKTVNNFHTTIGGVDHTNLPNATFDLIFSNATVHNFTAIDSIMTDIGRKLKPGALVFFRDSFKNDHGETEFCSDPKCGRPLLTIDEFMTVMNRNGFKMVKRAPDMSGYPVFGFILTAN